MLWKPKHIRDSMVENTSLVHKHGHFFVNHVMNYTLVQYSILLANGLLDVYIHADGILEIQMLTHRRWLVDIVQTS